MKKNTNNIVKSLAPTTSVIKFAVLGLGLLMSSGVSASSVQGGQMTINLDRDALAGAFTANNDPSRPSFYFEEYFDAAQANSRTSGELLTSHIVPGAGEISGIGRQLSVNGSVVSGFNQATSLTFDSADLTGTASGVVGLGGAMRYRLNTDFTIDPDTGEETGNRVITAYFSLEYDASRVDDTAGHSGWVVYNHHSFRAPVFDLDNVVTNLTGDSLSLSGDLALAGGFNHLGGQLGAVVGDFNFQTTVVPVPAAVWLFGSALAGLSFARMRKEKVAFC